MDIEFSETVRRLFGQLINQMASLDADVRWFKEITNKWSKANAESQRTRAFEEFEKVFAAMYKTSGDTHQTISQLHEFATNALEVSTRNNLKGEVKLIKKIIEEIKKAERQNLAVLNRLPFSVGSGWKPSHSIPNARHIANIVGYLLVAPVLFSKKGKAMYSMSLHDIDDVMDNYREAKKKSEETLYGLDGVKNLDSKYDAEEEVRKAGKDFQVFIRVYRQIQRDYRRARKNVNRLLKDLKEERDGETLLVNGKGLAAKEAMAW